MQLAYVSVRNYRGIQRLELTLGPTTTLIGENAYGKSNLLDALLVCLGAGADDARFAFVPSDFRTRADAEKCGEDPTPGSCDRIEVLLGFRESSEGEWDHDVAFRPIRAGIHHGPRGERRLELAVRSTLDRDADGGASLTTRCDLVDSATKELAPAGSDVIELLRSRVPVVVMKADRYFTMPSRVPADAHRSIAIEERLEQEIASAYRALADYHETVPAAEIERGLDAARAYVLRYGGERLQRRVKSFLGPSVGATGVSGAARSMALLLVLGGLLAAHAGSAFGPQAHPVVAIEDPEAYLHPTVLAAVAAVIRAIPAQKILTTNAGEMLSHLPLASLRRLVRADDGTRTFRLGRNTLSDDEMRRIAYHVKANRGTALFARCWMLVEGETEFWLLPELAETLGYDFALEGVRIIEFAQVGVEPLVRFADDLGIAWHLLADGDQSGRGYVASARGLLSGRAADAQVTALAERDIEHCLWSAGYDDVYRNAVAGASARRFDRRPRVENPTPTIERAIRARSKPGMAVAVADVARNGGPVPQSLRHAIERVVALARATVR